MANRRPGGYGGGRPNFNSGPNYNSGSVNPWQGGNVPGNQYNSSNPSNLLSQLSEPQAQLALALTKLLQPQQQVPSLLSMNTNPPMQNRGFGGPGTYNRNGPGNMNNRRPQNMKPFNKMNNRNDGFKNNQMQRRPNRSQPKIINKNIKPQRSGTAESKDSKINKPSSAKASPTKSQDAKISDTDEKAESSAADATITSIKDADDKSEDVDGGENKKRDWKEEKNDESDSQVVNLDKEEDEIEAKDEEGENEKNDDDSKKTDSVYDDIPKELLQCFICQKRMWDAKSFENHIKGRAHQQMCEKVDDSYRIKADMMRESIRLSEEKNNIEMERMKRLGKKTKSMQLSRCAMCDLEFYGQLFLHRKSSGHQKLKQFLHPKCLPCNKEFPTRMEWDNHRHTSEHLRKKAACDKKQGKSNKEQDDGIMLEEESFIIFDIIDNEDIDEPNAILDITDSLPEDNIPIPTYKSNRIVGSSLIEPVTGFLCKPCSKFFLSEKTSILHTQTKMHYDSFVAILNEKNTENEEKKRKPENEDDEGNWKRRKTTKEEESQSKNKKNHGDDLYDPMECDNDNDVSIKEKDQSGDTLSLNTSNMPADPNDISLDNFKSDSKIIEDIWKETDKDDTIEIIDDSVSTTQETSPIKAKPLLRPQRAVRGRRH